MELPQGTHPTGGFTIVVIEDEPALARVVSNALARESLDHRVAGDGETGLSLVRALPADLVVLDVTLPGIDGIETCRRIREFSDAYVIMLTGRGSETDRVIGLSVGADDYMTKPFYASELVARIRAMQRRPRAVASAPPAGESKRFGALTIDPAAREVRLGDDPVELSRIEFELLAALAEQPRVSLSRTQLLERVWGPNWYGDDHVIDVHVSNLRRKLGDDPAAPRYVRTVRGHGYRMGTG